MKRKFMIGMWYCQKPVLLTKFNLHWDMDKEPHRLLLVQWNLSVTTTSIIKYITCDLFSNVFNRKYKDYVYRKMLVQEYLKK